MHSKRSRRRKNRLLPVMLCLVAIAGAALGARLFGLWPGDEDIVVDPDTQTGHDLPDQPLPGSSTASGGPESAPPQSGPGEDSSQPPPEQSPSSSNPPASSGASEAPPASSSSAPDVPDTSAPEGSYAALYFYEADKAGRYAAYHTANPTLTDEDVVWQVNAGIDGTPYTDYEAARYTDTSYFIVSKHRKLPDNFEPAGLVDIGGYKATAEAAAAYFKMQADAKAEGYSFWAISAYRSIESQRNLYNGYLQRDPAHIVDTYSARPGFSEHHTGRAIDLCGSNGNYLNFENAPEGPWVHQNAYKYGFILRYPKGYTHITGYDYESWHMTYVGVDVATDMHDKAIATLEEYTVKYLDHRPG